MTLPRNLAGIGGPRKIDQAKLRKAVGGVRVWISQAKVLDDQAEDDSGVDVLVRLIPSAVRCYARMVSPYAGKDFGELWRPAEGDTVLCCLQQEEDGDLGAVFIVGALYSSTRKKPTGDSAGKRRIVIRDGDDLEIDLSGGGTFNLTVVGNGKVNITTNNQDVKVDAGTGTVDLRGKFVKATQDGTGDVALATKADLDAFKAWVDLHTHTETSTETLVPTTLPSPTAAGTSVLKGK